MDATIFRKGACSVKGADEKGAGEKSAGTKDYGKIEDKEGADCTNDVGRKGVAPEGGKGTKMSKAASGAKSVSGGAGVKLEDLDSTIDYGRKGVAPKGGKGFKSSGKDGSGAKGAGAELESADSTIDECRKDVTLSYDASTPASIL